MADFFDKVKDGFNKGVATISENSKIFAEKAKLNTAIKEAEKEKKQLCELFGQQMYRLYTQGFEIPQEVTNFCNEIRIREEKIEEFKNSIKELDEKPEVLQPTGVSGGIVCGACGFSNKPDSAFCIKCGNKLR